MDLASRRQLAPLGLLALALASPAHAGLLGARVAQVGQPLSTGGPSLLALAEGGRITDHGHVGFHAEVGTGEIYAVWTDFDRAARVLVEETDRLLLADGVTFARPDLRQVLLDDDGEGVVGMVSTEWQTSFNTNHWARARLGAGLDAMIAQPGQDCPTPEAGQWASLAHVLGYFADGRAIYVASGCGTVWMAPSGALTDPVPVGSTITGVEDVETTLTGLSLWGSVGGVGAWATVGYECAFPPGEWVSLCPQYSWGRNTIFGWVSGSAVKPIGEVITYGSSGVAIALPGDDPDWVTTDTSGAPLGLNRDDHALRLVRRFHLQTFAAADALFVARPDGGGRFVLREGEEIADLPGQPLKPLGGFLADNGTVIAKVRLLSDGNAATNTALVRVDITGHATLLGRAGDDLGGGFKLNFDRLTANPSGDVLVATTYSGLAYGALQFYAHDRFVGETLLRHGEPGLRLDGADVAVTAVSFGADIYGNPLWSTGVDGQRGYLNDDRMFVVRAGDALVRAQIAETPPVGAVVADFGPCPSLADGSGPQCGDTNPLAIYPVIRASGGAVDSASFRLDFEPPALGVEVQAQDATCDFETEGERVTAADCALLGPTPLLEGPGDEVSPVVRVSVGLDPVEVTLTGAAYDASGAARGSEPVSAVLEGARSDLAVRTEWVPATSCPGGAASCALLYVTPLNLGPTTAPGGEVALVAEVSRPNSDPEPRVLITEPCAVGPEVAVSCVTADAVHIGTRFEVWAVYLLDPEVGDELSLRLDYALDPEPENNTLTLEVQSSMISDPTQRRGLCATTPGGLGLAAWAPLLLVLVRRRR